MFVADIYSELKGADVLGSCRDDEIFPRLTDAVRLISNMGIQDPSIAEMSLCVCDGCVTLPSDVDTVLAINQAGYPTLLRDQWFQYHANGPGSASCVPWRYSDVLGSNFCTYKDPSGPVYLTAEVESSRDSNKPLRVFAWTPEGKRIFTPGPDGTLQDGFLVPTVFGFSERNPVAPLVGRIDRVQKTLTDGYIKLLAINEDGTPHTQIGYYLPNETSPSYVRIRVPDRNWLKIRYRKRNLEVRSVNDWINVDNREALILCIKAVQFRRKNQPDMAKAMESEASRILGLEAESKRPPGISPPQIIFNEGIECGTDSLFY
jgi:hypothetical protein